MCIKTALDLAAAVSESGFMAEVHKGSAQRVEEWVCREEVETERRQLLITMPGEGKKVAGKVGSGVERTFGCLQMKGT